jgi:hypothetical protein
MDTALLHSHGDWALYLGDARVKSGSGMRNVPYSYRVRWSDARIVLIPRVGAETDVPLMIQLPAGTSVDRPTAADIEGVVRQRLVFLGLDVTARAPLRLTRIDLTADFLFPGGVGAPHEVPMNWIITRAQKNQYKGGGDDGGTGTETGPLDQGARGNSYTGFHVGIGDIVCTLYGKKTERTRKAIRGPMKLRHWQAVWARSGAIVGPEDQVWRLEFQLRKDALRRWAPSGSLAEFFEHRDQVLEYLVGWRTDPDKERRGAWIRVAEYRSRNNRPLVNWWSSMMHELDGLDLDQSQLLAMTHPPRLIRRTTSTGR